MKRNCLNCHFLSKEHREETSGGVYRFSLKRGERKNLEEDPLSFERGFYSFRCHMGVWDEAVSRVAEVEEAILFSQGRGESCFFIPYKESMLFPAAIELQKRNQENKNLKKSYKLTIIGLWLAAIGLLLNGI